MPSGQLQTRKPREKDYQAIWKYRGATITLGYLSAVDCGGDIVCFWQSILMEIDPLGNICGVAWVGEGPEVSGSAIDPQESTCSNLG